MTRTLLQNRDAQLKRKTRTVAAVLQRECLVRESAQLRPATLALLERLDFTCCPHCAVDLAAVQNLREHQNINCPRCKSEVRVPTLAPSPGQLRTVLWLETSLRISPEGRVTEEDFEPTEDESCFRL